MKSMLSSEISCWSSQGVRRQSSAVKRDFISDGREKSSGLRLLQHTHTHIQKVRSSYLKEIIGREGAGWEILTVMRIQGCFCCMRSKHGYRGSHNDFLGSLNDSKVSSYNGFKVSGIPGPQVQLVPTIPYGSMVCFVILSPPFSHKKENLIIGMTKVSWVHQNFLYEGFPGGSVDKNAPANAGDRGSIPGLGRFHLGN